MAASTNFIAQCTGIVATYNNAAGNPVLVPAFPSTQFTGAGNVSWLSVQCTPSATTASFDHVNGTTVGMTSITIDKSGVESFASAQMFRITGRIKAGATTALLANLIIAKINAVEVGRFYVDATVQKCGFMQYALPGNQIDSRFALTGANDMTFTLLFVDPALEICLELNAGD